MQTDRLFGPKELREIGRYVRLEREKAGLTQSQVAEGASMSARAVRDLEAGRSNPTLLTIVAVVDVLALSLDELIAAARTGHPRPDVTAASDVGPGVTLLTRNLQNPRLRASIMDFSDVAEHPALPGGAVFGHVLEGSVRIALDGEAAVLRRGDSLHARSGVLGHLKADDPGSRVLLVETAQDGTDG